MTPALRFAIVGVLATGIHVLVLALLVEFADIPAVPASVPAFLTAVLSSYCINRSWTFASTGRRIVELARYLAVALSGLTLNVAIMHVAVASLNWNYWLGISAVVAIVPIFTFALNRYWTFAMRAPA